MGTADRMDKTLDEAIREHRQASIEWNAGFRQYLIDEYGPNARITDEMEREASRRYALDNQEKQRRLDELAMEVEVASAALARRRIEAEEAMTPSRMIAASGGH
jgi:hypothetical protein